MSISENVRFFGEPAPDGEDKHPPGASIARLFQAQLRERGWMVSDLERLKQCVSYKNHIQMSEEARATNASWIPAARSVRKRSLRKLCSHDAVRSTTQR